MKISHLLQTIKGKVKITFQAVLIDRINKKTADICMDEGS